MLPQLSCGYRGVPVPPRGTRYDVDQGEASTKGGRPAAAAAGSPLLEQVLALENLRLAWQRVHANHGAAGPDGVSLKRFARLLDANLLALADEVAAGTYQPGRERQLIVYAGRKRRTITIQPVRDRVLQRAALELVGPHFEAMFLPASYGYRPGRSVHQAVDRIVRLRERGFHWVVNADITDCFGTLDHRLLRHLLHAGIEERRLRQLLDSWVGTSARGVPQGIGKGIRLGAVISPLYCNVYLHQFDLAMARRRLQLVRYADDFVVLTRSEADAQRALRAVKKVLGRLALTLNAEKTGITSFDDGFSFLGVWFRDQQHGYDYAGKHIEISGPPPRHFPFYPTGYNSEAR